jgi:hypothetical protein
MKNKLSDFIYLYFSFNAFLEKSFENMPVGRQVVNFPSAFNKTFFTNSSFSMIEQLLNKQINKSTIV